jgi:hypothetical protein
VIPRRHLPDRLERHKLGWNALMELLLMRPEQLSA